MTFSSTKIETKIEIKTFLRWLTEILVFNMIVSHLTATPPSMPKLKLLGYTRHSME